MFGWLAPLGVIHNVISWISVDFYLYVPGLINSLFLGDGHPTFSRESLQWVYNP